MVEARSAQADLREVIARYARAISSRDIGAVRSAYPGITRDQQQGFERFFSSTKSLTASLLIGGLDVRDRSAEGRVTGTYEFIGGSGRKEVQMVSFRAQFERDGETWRLTACVDPDAPAAGEPTAGMPDVSRRQNEYSSPSVHV